MRYLFAFLLKNHFYFLFILLEVIALTMLFNSNHYQGSVFFNATSEITGRIDNAVSNVKEYFNLREQNRSLALENARLHALIPDSRLSYDTTKTTVTDTALKQQYTFTPAKVVHNSVSQRNNFLMLNKGSRDGIRPDMAVISPNGIVGIVSGVSPHFCWVNSVLHAQTKISVKIKKNDFVGSLVWDGISYKTGNLRDIPANVLIARGDTVVTSGYSNIFPQGIPVGAIRDFRVSEGYNFYDIDLSFFENYNRMSWVYIVTDFFKEEKAGLEKFTIDE